MKKRPRISFTDPVPEELADIDELLLRLRANIGGGQPSATDASGIGRKYRPERGDMDDRRNPVNHIPLGDDDFLRVSRGLSVLHHHSIDHAWVVHIAYNLKPGSPQALCRTLRLNAEFWCDYRNAGLRMLENILSGDVDAQWKMAYPVRTCKRVTEDALAD